MREAPFADCLTMEMPTANLEKAFLLTAHGTAHSGGLAELRTIDRASPKAAEIGGRSRGPIP